MFGNKTEYEIDNVYYQWLVRHPSWLTRSDHFVMPFLWGMVGIIYIVGVYAAVLAQGYLTDTDLATHTAFYEIIYYNENAAIIVFMISVVGFMFADLLFTVPMTVFRDTDRGLIRDLIVSPVSEREIVSNMRSWALGNYIRHAGPGIVLFGLALVDIFTSDLYEFSGLIYSHDKYRLLTFFIVSGLPALVFFSTSLLLVYHTGITVAALPRIVFISGAFIYFWIVPVVLVSLFAGCFMVELLFNSGVIPYAVHRAVESTFHNSLYEFYTLLVSVLFLFFYMESDQVFDLHHSKNSKATDGRWLEVIKRDQG